VWQIDTNHVTYTAEPPSGVDIPYVVQHHLSSRAPTRSRHAIVVHVCGGFSPCIEDKEMDGRGKEVVLGGVGWGKPLPWLASPFARLPLTLHVTALGLHAGNIRREAHDLCAGSRPHQDPCVPGISISRCSLEGIFDKLAFGDSPLTPLTQSWYVFVSTCVTEWVCACLRLSACVSAYVCVCM